MRCAMRGAKLDRRPCVNCVKYSECPTKCLCSKHPFLIRQIAEERQIPDLTLQLRLVSGPQFANLTQDALKF